MPPRTPRRASAKRTPYASRVKEVPEEKENTNTNVIDLIKYYKEKDKARDEYILALKEENAYLRKDSSAQPQIDYSSLIGLSIKQVGNDLHCTQAIEKEDITSSISFILSCSDGMYTYTFKDSNIEDLPEYLKKEIYFDLDQIKLFFFNVYECVAKRE
ncbi:hypothetical protein NEOKW01_1412 [Nematocida sp. AWRm80]|nr:hypothetical protein NEOKW01_1412 [Nematocida sp. AWRm80]